MLQQDETLLPKEFVQLLMAETSERQPVMPLEFLLRLVDTINNDFGYDVLAKVSRFI